MKNAFGFACFCIIFSSCKSQQLPLKAMNNYATDASTDDSVLNVLQTSNDVVLVFANQNFAWARASSYYILAEKKAVWKALLYGKKNSIRAGSGLSQKPVSYDSFAVNQKSCDSVLRYIQLHEIWKIKGDAGQGSSGCNMVVNDAASWRLMIFSGAKHTDATYNAPEILQEHCPTNDRKYFIETAKKIQALVNTAMDKTPS
jgi:hypothetical protein